MLGEISPTEIINPIINRDLNLLTSSFMKDRIMTNPNSIIREQKISMLEHLNQFKPSPTVDMYKDPFLKGFIEMRDRNNIPNMNWQQNGFPFHNNNPFQNFPRDLNRPMGVPHIEFPNFNDMMRDAINHEFGGGRWNPGNGGFGGGGFGNRPNGFGGMNFGGGPGGFGRF